MLFLYLVSFKATPQIFFCKEGLVTVSWKGAYCTMELFGGAITPFYWLSNELRKKLGQNSSPKTFP